MPDPIHGLSRSLTTAHWARAGRGIPILLLVLFTATVAAAQVGLPQAPAAEGTEEGEDEAKVSDDSAGEDSASSPRLAPHRENYILVATWAENPNGNVIGFRDVENLELKFQLSLRYLLASRPTRDGKLVFAYTNTSFWQLYNWDESSPFRTTDHEPEIFYEWSGKPNPDTVRRQYYRAGIVHESNGEGIRLSRSWNRLFGEYLVASEAGACRQAPGRADPKPGWCGTVKVWWVFEHDEVNNPDIDDYMGHFEARGEHVWRGSRRARLTLMLRNNLQSDDNRGAVQLDFSLAVRRSERRRGKRQDLRLRLQYFRGYGESLIDYDHDSNRVGLGFEFTY